MANYTATGNYVPRTFSLSSWTPAIGNILAAVPIYLVIVRLLRFQREQRIINDYRRETEEFLNGTRTSVSSEVKGGDRDEVDDGRMGLDLGRMSFTQASKIQLEIASLEFPYSFGHSLELGFIQVGRRCHLAEEGKC
jgi:hypothetical protein